MILVGTLGLGLVTLESVVGARPGGAAADPTFTALALDVERRLGAETSSTDSATAGSASGVDRTSMAPSACLVPPPTLAPVPVPVHPGASDSNPPLAAPVRRPVAVFLGDSYTSGYEGSGIGSNGWPAIVSAAYDWRMTNLAVPGTGFVNPGWTGQPMRTWISEVIRLRPGVVVIVGGHNDRRYGTTRAADAADALIDRLRGALPGTALVIIGPIWQDGSPATSIVGLRNRLRAKAAEVGATFIDPIVGGWFAGSSQGFIGPDGIHPTNAGHRHMAELVLAALRTDPRLEASLAGPEVATLPAPAAPVPAVRPRDPAGPVVTAAEGCAR
jgi:lysophospholipase L1-like esterase